MAVSFVRTYMLLAVFPTWAWYFIIQHVHIPDIFVVVSPTSAFLVFFHCTIIESHLLRVICLQSISSHGVLVSTFVLSISELEFANVTCLTPGISGLRQLELGLPFDQRCHLSGLSLQLTNCSPPYYGKWSRTILQRRFG